jgi:hypothetical protein
MFNNIQTAGWTLISGGTGDPGTTTKAEIDAYAYKGFNTNLISNFTNGVNVGHNLSGGYKIDGGRFLDTTTSATYIGDIDGTRTTLPVYINQNGSVKLTILNGGNVGIGNTSPDSPLHVSTTAANPAIRLTGNDPSNASVRLINTSGNTFDLISGITSITNVGFTIRDVTNSSDRITILNSGNVGIGVSPGYKLDVAGIIRSYSNSTYNGENGTIMAGNATVPDKKVHIGYDNTIDAGFIQSVYGGVAYKNLVINAASSVGNVGIGPGATSPATKLHVDGSTISTSFTDAPYYRIVNPGGASYVTTASTVTGALRIKLPILGSYGMIQMTVKIYQYSTGQSTTLVVGGYSYQDTGNYLWANVFAYQMGDTFRDINVRFGNDAGSDCIWIGETTDVWDYPQVFVTDVQVGFVGHTTNWLTNWSISYQTVFNAVITVRIARRPANSGYSTETLATVTARGNISTADVTINGNLTVGQSTATYIYMTDTDNTTRAIHCNSDRIGFLTSGAGWGSWCDNSGNWSSIGDVIAYYSDERLKRKVGKIENALEIIMSLNGFKYVNNDIAKDNGFTSDNVQIGLSAQEVQKVAPEIVSIAPFDLAENNTSSKSGEDYLTVNYAKLIPILVEAMKEQQKEIEELRKLINNK